MGMFQVRVRVANPSERSRFFDEDFWVDTGALYSFIPERRLNEIGIRPLRTRELILRMAGVIGDRSGRRS